jgi:enterochelin esterase-like enzyme
MDAEKIKTKKYGPELLKAIGELKEKLEKYGSHHHYKTYELDYNGIMDRLLPKS